MHPAFEIDQRLRAYLDSGSLDELREWFHSNFGALMALSPESKPLELATALQLGLLELERGGFSERQLKRYLRAALDNTFNVAIDQQLVLTTSGNATQSAVVSSPRTSETVFTHLQSIPTDK